ncbi:SDR family oxidoreductase [Luteococcus sp.]|uniref:SDR family oxidoreductase n=1 Tax=Luteococcus sp. TaxID=1969402 RepID=UPI003736AA10
METTVEPTIAVTGATGHLGGLVARALAERGIPQRLVVRDPSRAPQLPGAVAVQASYEDVAALTEAVRGVETVLFVSGHEGPQRMAQHRAAIEAFVAARLKRVVYTSFLGGDPQASFTYARDHHETEQLLRASGLGFTFLRPSFYLDHVAQWSDDQGVVRGPAGHGRIAWVSREDLAEVAVAALFDDSLAGRTLDVTGARLMTIEQTLVELDRVTGGNHRFVDETVEEAYASRRAAYPEAPDWELDGWVGTYLAIARGEMTVASDVVAELTGHPPRTFADLHRA